MTYSTVRHSSSSRPSFRPRFRRHVSVRIVAFKDDKPVQSHRTERLIGLANEFVHLWTRGAMEGPSTEVMSALSSIVDTDVTVKCAHPMSLNFEARGLDGIREKLVMDQHCQGSMRPTRAIMCAANEEDDSVFCLIECREAVPTLKEWQDSGRAPPPGGLEQGSTMRSTDKSFTQDQHPMEHRTFGIVKFDILLDDTSRIITGITERSQLGAADAIALHAVQGDQAQAALSAPTEKQTNADRAAASASLAASRQLPGTWHFPVGHIREEPRNLLVRKPDVVVEMAKKSMKSWCEARCSKLNEEELITNATDMDNFLLWDGYGMMPSVCGLHRPLKAAQAEGSPAEAAPLLCVASYGPLLDMIRQSKERYEIECTLLDSAVCPFHNVGFVHWRSLIKARPGSGAEGPCSSGKGDEEDKGCVFSIDGMEVHVFNSQGRIQDIWMLRDPMPAEKKLIHAACAKIAAKSSSLSSA